MKSLLIAGTALTALLATYVIGANGAAPPAQAPAHAQAQEPAAAADGNGDGQSPTLTMTGQGTATAVPDQLTFTLTARSKRDTLQTALEASSSAMREAQSQLTENGVAAEDVATTGLQMNPEYDYPKSGPAVLTGYQVVQQARVSMDDLEAGGAAIAAVVSSGPSTVLVNEISLGVADGAETLGQARDSAVAQARAKAEQYAAAADVELGTVISIRELEREQSNPGPIAARAQEDGAAEVPIAAGEQESGVTVRIVWSLAG